MRKVLAPKICFEIGYSLDLAYLESQNSPTSSFNELDKIWDELRQWIPKIKEDWNNGEKILLEATLELLGRPFPQSELAATLIVCPLPSMSYPLVLNVAQFLQGSEALKPDFYFFSTLHHELLHRYLNECFSDVLSQSPILRVYIDNRGPRSLISHLHLFALQKAIYLRMDREEELKKIIEWNSASEDASYKRAWEIINKEQIHNDYLKELNPFLGQPNPTFSILEPL